MIPEHMLPHTVQRIRPATTTDAYGNAVRDYGAGTSLNLTAWLQQDQRKEPLVEGRDANEQLWLLVTNEQDVLTLDRIVFGALTFEVFGPPAPLYTPGGGYHHTEATLRKLDG